MTSATASASVVVIVDNDHGARVRLRALLEGAGYAVFTASDGAAALALLRSLPVLPRLVLLDPRMPIMDGWQFLDAKRADPAWQSVAVVMHKAMSDADILAIAERIWGTA